MPEEYGKTRHELLDELRGGQNPPLVWLYCSDSRVDYDLFDANPGDIFSIENAGNVFGLGDESRASLAYALSHFAVDGRLSILVMGHTHCGAVTAACGHFKERGPLPHPSISSLLRHIYPSVELALSRRGGDLVYDAISENVLAQMRAIRDFALEVDGIKAPNVSVYGAIYDISSVDDIRPEAWSLEVVKDGRKNPKSEIVRHDVEARNGSRRLDDFADRIMKIERLVRGKLPSSHGRKNRETV